jgi:hypothetical protein
MYNIAVSYTGVVAPLGEGKVERERMYDDIKTVVPISSASWSSIGVSL